MNKQMNELVAELKDNGQDFEFYPTTKDMVRTIWKYATDKKRYEKTMGNVGNGDGTLPAIPYLDKKLVGTNSGTFHL